MSNNINQNGSFLPYVYIILSIVIFSFFVYPKLGEINLIEDENELSRSEILVLEEEKAKLTKIKEKISED
ncbi:MAG: hypothetical protein U9Q66_00175 [Patescibacteria group bacterium]|nr:hypothetical protein [Patescibacteria group bacterium]